MPPLLHNCETLVMCTSISVFPFSNRYQWGAPLDLTLKEDDLAKARALDFRLSSQGNFRVLLECEWRCGFIAAHSRKRDSISSDLTYQPPLSFSAGEFHEYPFLSIRSTAIGLKIGPHGLNLVVCLRHMPYQQLTLGSNKCGVEDIGGKGVILGENMEISHWTI